jgi:hypothetical protein
MLQWSNGIFKNPLFGEVSPRFLYIIPPMGRGAAARVVAGRGLYTMH